MNVTQLSSSEVILMADCGQVNNFEAPASPTHPMMEEFYLIDSMDQTFRLPAHGKGQRSLH